MKRSVLALTIAAAALTALHAGAADAKGLPHQGIYQLSVEVNLTRQPATAPQARTVPGAGPNLTNPPQQRRKIGGPLLLVPTPNLADRALR